MEDDELPAGWVASTLDEFTQERSRSIDPRKQPDRAFELYSVPSFYDGKPEVTSGSTIGSSKQIVAADSVLLCKINPRINRSWRVKAKGALEQIASTEWIVFPPSEAFVPDYLRYFMQQQSLRNFLATNVSGVGGSLMRVKPSTLNGYAFPLAPLPEQQRIVEKIETLFAELDKGEEALREVQKLLARYRQSVLKAAVTGAFTADWRAANGPPKESGKDLLTRILKARREAWKGRGKYKEPVEANLKRLPTLPAGWTWASIDQVTSVFRNGLSRKPQTEPNEFPILRISAVRPMEVSFDDLRYYSPEDGENIDDSWARQGDLLFTRYNGSAHLVGVCGLIDMATHVLHPDKLIKTTPVSIAGLCREFLELAWNAGETRKHIEANTKTTSGQQGIAGGDIKAAAFPLPPSEEQEVIAERVSEAFTRNEQAASWCETELKRSAALRQSILKDAYSGKLVPQDPSDEPAEKLLKRIRLGRKGGTKRRPGG